MNKLIAAIKRAPKRTSALLAMIAAAIIIPAGLFAWGPERPTYTYDNPAPHVTFNSMTGTPNYGDERNFVRVKEATAANNTYTDDIAFQPGKEYMVMVYFHNNARQSLNSAENGYVGIAQNAKMRVQMPATVKAGEKARITGFVSASNAQPQTVWDEAYGSVSNNVALRYVPDSATIYSNGAVDGQKLPESLYTTGTNLGYDQLDGKLSGCNEFAGFVTYKIKVDQPNFEVQKEVSKLGQNTYSEQVTSLPGEKIEYKIHYKNTGTTNQENVVISDQLPAGVTYVDDSTQISNGASNFTWKPTTDNEVTKGGINIGAYAPGAGAYVKFTAKVVDNSQLEKCGVNTLVNTGTAKTQNGTKQDTANVVVSKTCVVPPPVYTCDALTAKLVSGNKYTFDGKATATGGATIVNYIFNFGDGTSVTVTNPANVPHTYATANATYTATLNVTVKVNGSNKTVTSEACKVKITVSKPPVNECKPGIPTGDARCEPTPPVTPPTPPVTPPELPTTGAGENIAAFLGLGAMIASIGYYVTSRRAALNR